MEKLEELREMNSGLAEALEAMTYEQLLDHCAGLEKYKDANDFFEKDLEHIINLGLDWLEENGKANHYIYIEKDKTKLVQKEIIETYFL